MRFSLKIDLMTQTFWCIVKYSFNTPLYYCGYYFNEQPVVSSSFNNGIKLHSKEAADQLAAKI